MTERRPHWDDELLFAVMSAAGDGGHLFIDDIYAVIAAVENWHVGRAASDVSLVDILWARARAEKAEAAIARVRELCEAKTQEVAASDPLFRPPCALYVDDILHALEGDA